MATQQWGWLTTMRRETTIWTQPGTDDFLVRETRKGRHHNSDDRLDPDG